MPYPMIPAEYRQLLDGAPYSFLGFVPASFLSHKLQVDAVFLNELLFLMVLPVGNPVQEAFGLPNFDDESGVAVEHKLEDGSWIFAVGKRASVCVK